MSPGKVESSRFELLDLARGIAALGILMFHAYPVPIFSTLYTLVDFFFVLSGFVLAPSYLRVNTFGEASRFLANRAFRLFPMAITTLIFVVGIQVIVDIKHVVLDESNSSRIDTSFMTLFAAFGLLQIFSHSATLLNYPLWSLSAEWLSNFFVVSRPIFRKYNPSFFFVIGCLFIWHFQSSGNGWEEQFGRAISGFYFGILLRQTSNRRNLGTRYRLIASLVFVIFLNASIYFVGSKLSYLSPLIYGLAIIQLSCVPIRPKSRIHKVANFLGRYSYGFYAWHFPLLSISGILIEKVLVQFNQPSLGSQHLTVLLCFTLTMAFTHLTLKYLETPLRSHRARKIA